MIQLTNNEQEAAAREERKSVRQYFAAKQKARPRDTRLEAQKREALESLKATRTKAIKAGKPRPAAD